MFTRNQICLCLHMSAVLGRCFLVLLARADAVLRSRHTSLSPMEICSSHASSSDKMKEQSLVNETYGSCLDAEKYSESLK